MKISKTLITATLTCCLTSGLALAQEVKHSESTQLIKINHVANVNLNVNNGEEDSEPTCGPLWPWC